MSYQPQQPQPIGQQQQRVVGLSGHHHPPPSPKGPPPLGSQQMLGPPQPGLDRMNQGQPGQPGPVMPHIGRIMELVDALKHEVEMIHEEASFSKHHRKDLEGKLAAQISEMVAFQKSIYELDRMHHAIKAGYEEDIKRLRHELESRGIPIPPSANPYATFSGLRRHSISQSEDMSAHKRFKDANSNPIPSPRHLDARAGQQPMPPIKTSGIQRPGESHPHGHPPPSAIARQQSISQQQQPPKPLDESLVLVANTKIQKANVNVELVHSFDHGSVVCCVKFSPDGKYLATGCNHFAQIFEISSGRKILALVDESVPKQEDLYIRSVCFSPDGVYLATGAEDRIIRIWDIVNGKIKVKLSGHAQDIYSLDWTKDGKSIVSGSGDHAVKIWDPETGACLRTLQSGVVDSDKANGKDAGVTSVAIRPTDGRCVVAASLDEMIRVWDLRTGHLLERFEGHENSVYSVAFSPDGLSIVSGSLDQTLRIWDLSPQTLSVLSAPPSSGENPEVVITKNHRHKFAGHKDYVLSVGYPGFHSTLGRVDASGRPIHDPSFDVEWVISGSKDRLVVFWDAKDSHAAPGGQSAPVLTMTGHKNSVISIAMGPTGGLFATGSGDMKARVWRVSRPSPQNLPSHTISHHASDSNHPTIVGGNGLIPNPTTSPPVSNATDSSKSFTLAPVLSLPVVKPVETGPVSANSGPKSASSNPPGGSPTLKQQPLPPPSHKSISPAARLPASGNEGVERDIGDEDME